MTQNETLQRQLREMEIKSFESSMIDWIITIQREFGYLAKDVTDMNYFQFTRIQKFLIKEQKETEKAMKTKK